MFTIGYYPDKYIAPSGDLTGATDTARFKAALAQKGTIVLAEDASYTINSTITIDPAHVMFLGNGSLITALQTGTAPNSADTVTLEIICTNGIGQTTTVTRTITVA